MALGPSSGRLQSITPLKFPSPEGASTGPFSSKTHKASERAARKEPAKGVASGATCATRAALPTVVLTLAKGTVLCLAVSCQLSVLFSRPTPSKSSLLSFFLNLGRKEIREVDIEALPKAGDPITRSDWPKCKDFQVFCGSKGGRFP